eukprot:CCRYP_011953-RA/>CCRYP_011953-RA protein AED:0.47 eAED:0.47 QI:0/-1/0/1/-1/0/1/0/32
MEMRFFWMPTRSPAIISRFAGTRPGKSCRLLH